MGQDLHSATPRSFPYWRAVLNADGIATCDVNRSLDQLGRIAVPCSQSVDECGSLVAILEFGKCPRDVGHVRNSDRHGYINALALRKDIVYSKEKQ